MRIIIIYLQPSNTGRPRHSHPGKGFTSWNPYDSAMGKTDFTTSSFSIWFIEHVLYTTRSKAGTAKINNSFYNLSTVWEHLKRIQKCQDLFS